MDIRRAKEFAGWYASYMDDDQGKSLVECLFQKMTQQEDLINRINGEIELCDNPKEESPIVILNSIKDMIKQDMKVSVNRGYFGWVA